MKMKIHEWVEQLGSHNVYKADAPAHRFYLGRGRASTSHWMLFARREAR